MTLWQIIPLAYLAVVTIPLVRIDWKTHKLPNAWVMPGYVALVIAWIGVWMTTGEYPMLPAISAAGYFTFMLLLSYGGGMGMGDVKLVAGLSLLLAWFDVGLLWQATLWAFGLATVVVLVGYLAKKITARSTIALGPYLLLGFWVVIIQPAWSSIAR